MTEVNFFRTIRYLSNCFIKVKIPLKKSIQTNSFIFICKHKKRSILRNIDIRDLGTNFKLLMKKEFVFFKVIDLCFSIQ